MNFLIQCNVENCESQMEKENKPVKVTRKQKKKTMKFDEEIENAICSR